MALKDANPDLQAAARAFELPCKVSAVPPESVPFASVSAPRVAGGGTTTAFTIDSGNEGYKLEAGAVGAIGAVGAVGAVGTVGYIGAFPNVWTESIKN
jgi:hypothetical protein